MSPSPTDSPKVLVLSPSGISQLPPFPFTDCFLSGGRTKNLRQGRILKEFFSLLLSLLSVPTFKREVLLPQPPIVPVLFPPVNLSIGWLQHGLLFFSPPLRRRDAVTPLHDLVLFRLAEVIFLLFSFAKRRFLAVTLQMYSLEFGFLFFSFSTGAFRALEPLVFNRASLVGVVSVRYGTFLMGILSFLGRTILVSGRTSCRRVFFTRFLVQCVGLGQVFLRAGNFNRLGPASTSFLFLIFQLGVSCG